MERIKRAPVLGEELERVALVELEGVVRLWLDVDADHVEARTVVAHACAASPAEQVQQPRPAHSAPT